MNISNIREFREAVRHPYAWPGGYPTYFITDDGGALCHACVKKERRNILESVHNHQHDGWRVVALDINYEDEGLQCDHCGGFIAPALAGKVLTFPAMRRAAAHPGEAIPAKPNPMESEDMKTILVTALITMVVLVFAMVVAGAHPSFAPHVHHHGVSAFPDAGWMIVASVLGIATYFVAYARKK